MSDSQPPPLPADDTPQGPPGPAPPRGRGVLGLAFRMVQVRLRLIAVLFVAFLVVGRWESLRNHWDKLMRRAGGAEARVGAISSDTEYFCPMDPGVVSDWPGKCSICNMALVRRKRGEAVPLPDGVVARMQFSPYRLQLAGVQTSPVAYRPLTLEVVASGTVASEDRAPTDSSHAIVDAEIFEKDLPAIAIGEPVEVQVDSLIDHPPFRGVVREIRPASSREGRRLVVRIRVEDPRSDLRPGMSALARLKRPIDQLEPFRSQPADPPPLRKGERRVVYVCAQHPQSPHEAPGRCPRDQNELEAIPLEPGQRVGWWCPMHPGVTADRPGGECRECEGMKLVPRVVTYRPSGQVLTIPESSVVDTGRRKVAYVERMPGMFDGVEVVLGPRCGDDYPVVRGLEPGQRVATAGAFLIDAETRLNPSVAAAYFGSGPRPSAESRGEAPASAGSDASPDDLALAKSQKICPVTGKPLGSMGTPVRVVVAGRAVLICCDGCEAKLKGDPKKYLSKLP